MTIKEVATRLELAEETVDATVQASKLPAFKIPGQWRIERGELSRWLHAQPRANRNTDGGHDGQQ
ncbi:MAG: helix-turn-helix domain-containing protein [Polyangiaceae bacterium]|nr:helix-turn-helix domain-containing protein [Polyangiaceae bacterium]MCW5788842.1 helix-turn-helix domain-containing protein [Polyangiaceae bacterium]